MAGRSRKPGLGRNTWGRKGVAGSEALTHGTMNEIEFLGKTQMVHVKIPNNLAPIIVEVTPEREYRIGYSQRKTQRTNRNSKQEIVNRA